MLSPSAAYIAKRGMWTGLIAVSTFLVTNGHRTAPVTVPDVLAVVVGFGLAWLAVELAAATVAAYRTAEAMDNARLTAELRARNAELEAKTAAIAREHAFLDAVLAQLPAGVMIVDPEGTILRRNDQHERLWRMHPQAGQLNQLASGTFSSPSNRSLPYENWPIVKALLQGESTEGFEARLTDPNDPSGTVQVSIGAGPVRAADGTLLGAVAVMTDVTERKATLASLRESEQRLRLALQAARMLAYEWDTAGFAFHAAEPLVRWCGLTGAAEPTTTGDLLKLIHSDDAESVRRAVAAVVGGATQCELEFRLPRPDGTTARVLCRSNRLTDAAGGLTDRVVGVMIDVTDRQRNEERLCLLESAVVHARDAVVILESAPEQGPGRSVLYANAAFCRMTGYETDEVLGRSLHFLRGPNSDPATLDRLRDALNLGMPFQGELLNYRKDGSDYWVELSVVPVPDRDGRCAHFVMIQRDVSDRRRTQEQLAQAQKMELIGQLAGGIAHDFNNILTGIIGNLARVALPPTDPNQPMIGIALTAAGRAADLTRKLLGFARRHQLLLAPLRAAEFVDEVLELIGRTFDPRIRLLTELDADATVSADATLMSQVLLNLCVNAKDAMPAGGTLTLRVATADVTDPPAEGRPGPHVRITVEDTGEGMPAEVMAHLFEPFFTTKPVGMGTGLGLAMVHGIMQQHDGWVECQSEPGVGTRFDLFLPRMVASPPVRLTPAISWAVTATPLTQTPHPTDYPTTVLLVDDEEMIRTLGRAVLESAGYHVLEAEDGEEAVELYSASSQPIDLVILDLTMPRMSGKDAFRQMAERDPGVRVLLSSGYTADGLADTDGILGLLPKPYRPAELLDAVRVALNLIPMAERPAKR